MKLQLTLLIALGLGSVSFAQVDYNKIILPDNVKSLSYQEKLIQLAWANNPVRRIYEIDEEIAKMDLKNAKNAWFDILSVNANLNEFTINELTGNTKEETSNLFFPRYNVNLRVPLSSFSKNAHAKRTAEQEQLKATEEKKLGMLQLRAKVLILYKEFLKDQEILRIRTSFEEDEKANFNDIEEGFRNGDATFDEYSDAQKNLYAQRIEKAQAENNYQKIKIMLEEMIGMPLELVTME
jgi:outer membrane protein TolC